ncbi:MAG: sugar transferase [Lachnospiraceae bacterium]|nr:sugar transferase [Lachnospiraceae bacterium]
MNQSNQRTKIIELYWLLAVDIIAIIISYFVALEIRFGSLRALGQSDIRVHYLGCICLMLFCAIFSLLIDWNKGFCARGYLLELSSIIKYNLCMVVVVGCVLFLMKLTEYYSRLTYVYFLIMNIALTFAAHAVLKKVLRHYMQSEHNLTKVIVVTEQEKLKETIETIQKGLDIGYQISAIAVVDGDMIGVSCDEIPIVANRENLMEVSKQLAFDEVFIRVENLPNSMVRAMINDFESMGVCCHYSIDIIGWNNSESSVGKFGSYTVVTYSAYHVDYQRRMIKRLMDILGSIVGLCMTLVMLPFVAIAIKVDSPGPIFFSQTRIGKNGRRFQFYKFRSMYTDAEERKKELQDQNEVRGLMFKIENDPRITKVGKFLRKTSIDELPQFYNVLRGDMSLIGTRPPTVDEFEQYSLYYRRRLCMTPGLTGLWQVSGRSDIDDFEQVVKLDLDYIDNWSLSLDIKILFKTIWVIFMGKGSK